MKLLRSEHPPVSSRGRRAHPRPFDGPGLFRRTIPFIATAYFTMVSFFLIPGTTILWSYMGPALALLVALTVAVFAVPWERLGDWAQPIIPFVFVGDALLLNLGTDGLGGIGLLVFLTVIWLALYGTPREVAIGVGLVALRFYLPIVLDLPNGLSPLTTQYRGLMLFVVISGLVGYTVNTVVWRLREVEDVAASAGERFRGLLEAAPDAMVVVDESGRIALVNAQTERLFGYQREELVGEPVEKLVPERVGGPHEGHRDGYLGDPHARPMGVGLDLDARRKDGSEFPVEISLSPLETEDGTLVTAAVRDISERLLAEEAQVRAAIVESSDDAIISKKLDGEILTWNAGAERLYGYSAGEAIGRNVSLLAPPELSDELPRLLEQVGRGIGVDHYETIRRAKDGRRLNVSITLSPIRDGDGRIVGVSAIGRDVTAQKRSEAELQRLSTELEARVRELAATNRELEAFAYSASHDLRTPLRAMDGFSRAVLEDYGDALDDDGRAMLERIRAGSQRMGQLIDEMLTLSRITRQELKSAPVDLSATAREIAGELGAEDPDRQVEWVVHDGLVAEGDPELLRLVLANLLDNAWKFTERTESPRIEFNLERVNGSRAYVVRDNGAGFDMSYAAKLFRPFERLHREDEYSGTGVGLATVQRIVHRHAGEVWAVGEVGQGASFHFSLGDRHE